MEDMGVASAVELGRQISEQEINVEGVAAYRASLDSGKPLSERKLAAMFGKTSRRWARSRMAEAREASFGCTSQVVSTGQDRMCGSAG